MARTKIIPLKTPPWGVLPMQDHDCDPVNGNEVDNVPGLRLVFLNRDTENPHTVTIITPAKAGGLDVEDITFTLEPYGAEGNKHSRICGGFNPFAFGRTVQFIADSELVGVTAYVK